MNLALDQDGHLVDENDWNTQIAQTLADTLNIVLDDRHFKILHITRQYYTLFGHSPTTRSLVKFLNQQLDTPTSNAQLQLLFNTGLIARHINRLAGLPKPANCL